MHINVYSLQNCMTNVILFLYLNMVCTFPYIVFKISFIFEALYCTMWIYLTFLLFQFLDIIHRSAKIITEYDIYRTIIKINDK